MCHRKVKMLLTHLTKLGFNQGEAKIYLALLNNGDATASELARKTSLGRTNIYNYAKSLQDKNMISDYERNGKVYFKASDPKELYNLLEIQKKELSHLSIEHMNLTPKFNKLYEESKKSPQVDFYLGKKEWKKLMRKIYLDQTASELYILVPDLDDYSPPPPVYQSNLYANKVFTYLVSNKGENLETFNKRDPKKDRKTMIVPKSVLPINETMVVFKDHFLFGNFESNNLEVFAIQDSSVSKLIISLLSYLAGTK